MKRLPADTRIALFEAGLAIVRRKGMNAVTLASVGSGAGVSRQAVYLHFGSRAGYLLAFVDYLNSQHGIADVAKRVGSATSALGALGWLIELRATSAPKLYPVITALLAAMASDADAQAVWAERQRLRYVSLRALAVRMRAEGLLRSGMSSNDAAAIMWTLLSFETWNYLVKQRKWPKRKYMDHVEQLVMRGVCRKV